MDDEAISKKREDYVRKRNTAFKSAERGDQSGK